MASIWCLYCWLQIYFTPCYSVSINFEQVNAGWEWNLEMIPDSLIVQQNRHKSSYNDVIQRRQYNDVNTSHCTCMPECTQFQLLCILLSTSQHLAWKTRLTLPAPCISESCIEIKINLNFYCYTSFWSLSRV